MRKHTKKLQTQKHCGKAVVEFHDSHKKWAPILTEQKGRFYVSGFGLRKSSE